MDKEQLSDFRLSRNNCTYVNNSYVKDLSKLGRDLRNIIIIDNSPSAYSLNKENAIPISTWIDDSSDNELKKLIPVLYALSKCKDVRKFIKAIVVNNQINYTMAKNIISNNKFMQYQNKDAKTLIDSNNQNSTNLKNLDSKSSLITTKSKILNTFLESKLPNRTNLLNNHENNLIPKKFSMQIYERVNGLNKSVHRKQGISYSSTLNSVVSLQKMEEIQDSPLIHSRYTESSKHFNLNEIMYPTQHLLRVSLSQISSKKGFEHFNRRTSEIEDFSEKMKGLEGRKTWDTSNNYNNKIEFRERIIRYKDSNAYSDFRCRRNF